MRHRELMLNLNYRSPSPIIFNYLDDLYDHHTAGWETFDETSFSLLIYFCFQKNHCKLFSDPQDAESDGPGWGNVNQAYEGEELQEPCEVLLVITNTFTKDLQNKRSGKAFISQFSFSNLLMQDQLLLNMMQQGQALVSSYSLYQWCPKTLQIPTKIQTV